METQYFGPDWNQLSATMLTYPGAGVTETQSFGPDWGLLSYEIDTVVGSQTSAQQFDANGDLMGGTVTTELSPQADLVQTYDSSWNPIAGDEALFVYGQAGGKQVLVAPAGVPTTFVLGPGQVDGDAFSGFVTAAMDPASHDVLDFVGFGPGAALTQVASSHWQLPAPTQTTQVFTLSGTLSVAAGDVVFN